MIDTNTNELVRQLDASISKDLEDLTTSEKKTETIRMELNNKLKTLTELVNKLSKMQ